jgi:hypothetical protein
MIEMTTYLLTGPLSLPYGRHPSKLKLENILSESREIHIIASIYVSMLCNLVFLIFRTCSVLSQVD